MSGDDNGEYFGGPASGRALRVHTGSWTPNQLLIQAAQQGDERQFRQSLRDGANINFADPRTGFTALHYASSREIRWLVNALAKHHNLNYLARDHKGRLPSTLAFEFAENAVFGTFLMKKEIKQARERGIDYRALLTGEIDA